MCFLKVTNKTKSFKELAKTTNIPVFSVYDKGEKRNKNKNYDDFRISFDVSQKGWDNFKGQVSDTITFLEYHFKELEEIISNFKADAFLDFPIYSRLNEEIVNQNDHLPKELIALAGKLNLGIEMAIYEDGLFDDEN